MPIIIALLIAIIGFVWWSWGRHRAGAELSSRLDRMVRRSPCKWNKVGASSGGFEEYRCSTCNMVGYSKSGKAPVTCKRAMRGRT